MKENEKPMQIQFLFWGHPLSSEKFTLDFP